MKIVELLKELSFFNKASLIATWIQTITVVIGTVIALTQLSSVISSSEKEKRKESLKLIEKYRENFEAGQFYLRGIHTELSNLSENIDKKKRAEEFEKLIVKIDKNQEIIRKSYYELSNYYENTYDCIRYDACDKEIIGNFLCETSEDFLNLGRYPEMRKGIDEVYNDFYRQMGNRLIDIRGALHGAVVIHIWNTQRMCPSFIRSKYRF